MGSTSWPAIPRAALTGNQVFSVKILFTLSIPLSPTTVIFRAKYNTNQSLLQAHFYQRYLRERINITCNQPFVKEKTNKQTVFLVFLIVLESVFLLFCISWYVFSSNTEDYYQLPWNNVMWKNYGYTMPTFIFYNKSSSLAEPSSRLGTRFRPFLPDLGRLRSISHEV